MSLQPCHLCLACVQHSNTGSHIIASKAHSHHTRPSFVFRLLPQPASPRSKKFKGPAGLPLSTPIIDPGHLLTKLNPDLAQKRCKRHEFSLETCLGPTIFHRTKVCSLYQPSSCLCFSYMLLSQSLLLLCFADFSCSIASPQHHVKKSPCLPTSQSYVVQRC